MRIKVTEERLSDTDPRTGEHHLWHKGDTAEVPDDYGAYLCSMGWVKDMDGNVPSPPRKPGVHQVEVQSAKITGKGRVK